MGVLNEVDADSYTPTIFAKSLVMPKYGDGISFWCVHNFGYLQQIYDRLLILIYYTLISFDCIGPPFIRLPEYLAKTDYRNPQSAVDGPFQYGHKSDLHFFDWLKANPKVLETFNNHMIGYRSGRQKWDDFYPVNDFLGKGMKADKDAVLLVDVGGGLGHDIDEFHHKHSNLPGRLILQDQPIVINDVKNISESIELMTHDFFTEQPVKGISIKSASYFEKTDTDPSSLGARAYYMHSILHDWPDDKARVILENLKPAMVKGYSKVLIDENVINSKGAHWMSTGLDWFMMGFFSSSERLESAWEQLLESAGMKIVKIWTSEQGTESLIEAELA